MDFSFTQEQQQLAEALARWLGKEYTFERRKAIVHSAEGVSAEAWRGLAELGLLALPVPEAHGGFDGTAVDMLPVMQQLGRGLLVEPYFATVLGAKLLQLGGRHGHLLEQVAQGALRLACALGERQSRHDLRAIAAVARADGDGWLLDGVKTVVLHGAQADYLLASFRTEGDEIVVLAVPADAPGVTRTDYRTIDGMRAADIAFANVHVGADALAGSWATLDAALDYGAALLCAEAVGAMDALFAATLDYLKTRQQFGVPIGKFQALQHRMAEMFIEIEQARSMALLAAVHAGSADEGERRRMVSAAKARVGQALTFVGQQAVQLHGGMGVTDELPAAHHFKRLTIIGLTLGDTDHHVARFMAQDGFLPAAA
jgi:alkylation response protein AidB-like acyl-CoA dehydrogenase